MNMFIDYEMVKAIDEIKRLRNELAVTEAAKRELAEKNKEYEGDIICLQGELIALYKNCNDHNGEILKLKSDNEKLEKKCAELGHCIGLAKASVDQLNFNIKRDEKKHYETTMELIRENDSLKDKLRDSEKAHKTALNDLEQANKVITELAKQRDDANESINAWSEAYTGYSDAYHSKLKEYEILKSERDALREVNSDLETENEKLYRQFIESEKARKGLVDDIERVKKDVKELIKENERLCRKKGNDLDD